MSVRPKQIIVKKPTLVIKKKGESANQAKTSSQQGHDTSSQSGAYGSHYTTHCQQCGGRRIPFGTTHFFDFHCTYCGQLIENRGYLSGTDMLCGSCGNTILVPPPPMRPVLDRAGNTETKKSEPMKFFCVFCGQKLAATKEMSGQQTTCPTCNRNLKIPPF